MIGKTREALCVVPFRNLGLYRLSEGENTTTCVVFVCVQTCDPVAT